MFKAVLIHRCVNKQASKHSVINEELREWDQDKFGALYVLPQDSGTIPKALIVASRNVWSSQATTGFCLDREWHCMLSPLEHTWQCSASL